MDVDRLHPRSWPDAQPAGLPWHDEEFSERMLAEHLDQRHDMASRRAQVIERHAATLLALAPAGSSILDLACGPGLYADLLADGGHAVLGIDVAPAAIRHAAANAPAGCRFRLGDVRSADLESGHGMAMMLFGQIDTFAPDDAALVLRRCRSALAPGGSLVLEVHRPETVAGMGQAPPTWWTAASGLFAATPHLVLEEHRWDATGLFADSRNLVIELVTGRVTEHLHRTHASRFYEWESRLRSAGFDTVADLGSFTDGPADRGLTVVQATA